MEYLLAEDLLSDLLHRDNFIGLVAIVMGCSTGMVAIVFSMVAGVLKTKAREETKRELAAYVAEGTIDPDKAIAMMNAGDSSCSVKIGGEKFTVSAPAS